MCARRGIELGGFVSFRSREAKRRKKAAVSSAQAKARATGSARSRWWLTVVVRKCCCANPACHGMLLVGRPMVYRASPREALCEPCAQSRGIRARPSAAWEQARRRKAKK